MRVWDLSFALLVLFPILTGGIWGKIGSAKIEYTQPGIAALLLALWAAFLWKRGTNVTQKSFFLRTGKSLWRDWRIATEERFLPLTLAWIAVSLLWFLAALSRHRGFQTHAADLGIFTNAIWNVADLGAPYSSIKGGVSLLADHQNFLIYPFGWLYRIWPSPVFLLLLQAFGLASGGLALFMLARQRLGRSHALVALLPWLFWAAAPIRAANLFDFHPEVMMLPLFLFAAWGLQHQRWSSRILGFFLFSLALLAKESAGPVACGLGLAWILGAGPSETRKFTRLFGFAAAAIGFGMFYFDTKIVPGILGGDYGYGDVYAPFGSSLIDLARAPFLYPQEFFARVFGISRLQFLAKLLLPFLFLPLLGWRGLIVALPGCLMLFLGAGDQRLSGFHYAIEPMVGILFALPLALAHPFAHRHRQALLCLLPLAALVQFGRSEVFHWRSHSLSHEQKWARDEVLPQIQRDRAVTANSALVPHIANRGWVHFLPNLSTPNGRSAQCVVWENTVNQTPLGGEQSASLRAHLEETFDKELDCPTLTIYRAKQMTPCLFQPVKCP